MDDMAKKAPEQATAVGAAAEDWSVAHLVKVLRSSRSKDRAGAIRLLKQQGILSRDGKLAKRYRTWGKRITHTPSIEQMQGH